MLENLSFFFIKITDLLIAPMQLWSTEQNLNKSGVSCLSLKFNRIERVKCVI